MILRFCIVATYILQAAKSDIMESTGFHCKNANSMRLDRKLHGSPHLTIPPFEFTVLDEDGNYVEYYEPGVNYRRSLRGGRFILGDYGEIFGIQYHDCVGLANDSLTHTDNKKKFLIEALWTTDRDVGAVQFLLTVAAEDVLYWERWRPRNGFIRPRSQRGIEVNELLFKIEVAPGPEEPTLSPEEAASTMDPSELTTLEPFDSKLFEAIEEAEENESNRV
ncbi:unnamed protein product [Heligmosomoides polygyrus]|uniref:Reelin domain-containing protein n=1 Tax=Heligmosomoides polygyrus TaxID=6339 RepID=A0A3P7WRL3_HELPZ|nr:unnamed protein product [Heligmosomoides polygyrus]